jgi:glycogen synthase
MTYNQASLTSMHCINMRKDMDVETEPICSLAAARRAVAAYHDKQTWISLQQNCMGKDLSWGPSARAYHDIYSHLIQAHNKAVR